MMPSSVPFCLNDTIPLLSSGFFAVGAGLISGFFSVNESKYIVTTASKIHGISAAIGFMALLLFPLLNGIVSFKQNGTLCRYIQNKIVPISTEQ